jgi:Holliday junction resolvasome RuvABC endonuclease subunit
MNILALDLGTSTGWAFNNGEIFECGTWLLASDKEVATWGKDRSRRRCDPRVLRLHATLVMLQDKHDFAHVVFEDVQFGSTTYQTQLWSSFRAAVWLGIPAARIECVPVGTLKKFATGSGSATKEMMMASLARTDKHLFNKPLDDNAVDAIFLWKWAKLNLSRV